MSPGQGQKGNAFSARPRRSLFVAAVAIVLALGPSGAQAAGGALDPTFGTDGKVLTDLGKKSNDVAHAVAVQSHGKIVVVGWSAAWGSNDFALVRYTPGGKLDASFGRGGKVLTDIGTKSNDRAYAVAVQPDGRIVAAGSSWDKGVLHFALVRYTTGGKLDTSFGTGGKVSTGKDDWAHALALQKDGKIVVAGSALVRYTSAGKLDASFGKGGKVLYDLHGNDFSAYGAAVQTDGKIVLAGDTDEKGSCETISPCTDMALVRYTSAGKLDASFGKRGIVVTHALGFDVAGAVALRTDGKILLAGGSDGSFALLRYTAAGKLDASFGEDGTAPTDHLGSPSNEGASALALQKDGKIVVAGDKDATANEPYDNEARFPYTDFALARYTAAGKLDASFGRGGVVVTNFANKSDDHAYAVAVQRDGKIVAAGKSSGAFALARYTK